jgi:LEA14-like dessication related protein
MAFLGACKSPPPPLEPASELRFDHAEAVNVNEISLFYNLFAENPRSSPAEFGAADWELVLNGLAGYAAALFVNGVPVGEASVPVSGNGRIEIPVRLDLDMRQLSGTDGPAESYTAELTLKTAWRYGGEASRHGDISVSAVFPKIREPEFTITSIAILQDELINTRFRVNLRVDNPNIFPLDLSSFGYELYGDGLYWAAGEERDVLHVPAGGSEETKLFLVMNFINMKRNLLDDVIKMRMVRYRFKGEVMVGTDIEYLPRFNMAFDKSGLSEVFK